MAKATVEGSSVASTPLRSYRAAFLRSLAAENKSERTQQTYGEAVDQFGAFLAERGMPTDPLYITREHIEEWIKDLLANWKASTAKNRFRSLHRFFGYLVEVEELQAHPMAKMKAPSVDDTEVPVVKEEHLRKLLRACEGKGFRERRDMALITMFVDTGLRVSEMVGLQFGDDADTDGSSFVDVEDGCVWVIGKGRRHRRIPLGKKARKMLDLYLFARSRHAHQDSPMLWLGERGPMTVSGAYQALESRCQQADIPRIHPHQLRHTWAHTMKSADLGDDNIKYLAGWRTESMLARYGRSAQAERAMDAKRRLSPADRL